MQKRGQEQLVYNQLDKEMSRMWKRSRSGQKRGLQEEITGSSKTDATAGQRSNDSQWFGHFRKSLGCFQQLLAFVASADDRSQAGLSFGHRWIPNSRSKYACFKKFAGKFKRFRRITHVDRNDRCFAGFEQETALFQFAFEKFRVGPESPHQFFAVHRIQQCKCRLASCGCRRRMRRGEKERPRAQIEV